MTAASAGGRRSKFWGIVTGVGRIDEVYTQSMKGTFKGNVLEWDKELAKTQPGAVKETRIVPNPTSYPGLSVIEVKILSVALASIFFLSFAFSLVLLLTSKPVEISASERAALGIKKKYGERMAEAIGQTPVKDEKIIYLGSMADLITVADELGKPVIHVALGASRDSHVYFVLDGTTRYQYMADAGNIWRRRNKEEESD